MGKVTALDKLNSTIAAMLNEYAAEVQHDVDQVATEMGKAGAAAVRRKSRETFPVKKGRKITGKYAKGWTYQVKKTRVSAEVTIFNNHPALTHLLEHGHAKRGGGRTRAFPHIAPAEEVGEKQLEADIIRGLSNG